MTLEGLLFLLRDLKFLEAALGWILSNYAERWQWYQNKSQSGKMMWISVGCLVIGLLSTSVYYWLFGGEMPVQDAIANLLYSWGVSLVGSQARHARRKHEQETGRDQ